MPITGTKTIIMIHARVFGGFLFSMSIVTIITMLAIVSGTQYHFSIKSQAVCRCSVNIKTEVAEFCSLNLLKLIHRKYYIC